MQFKTRTEEEKNGLVELIENPKPKTLTKPRLKKPNITNTKNYAEDTSVIDLGTMKYKVRVCIRPFEDEDKFEKLLQGSENRKTYLFKGVTSPNLKELFKYAVRKISRDKFTQLEQDVFQAGYNLSQKNEIYAAAEKLNKDYKR